MVVYNPPPLLQDTSNGLLVHWQRASDYRYFLDFYDFTGALRSHNDLTAYFSPATSFQSLLPFDYTLQGGIYLTDPISFVTHVFDAKTFNYVKDLTDAPEPVLGVVSYNGVFQYLGATVDQIFGYNNGIRTYFNQYVSNMNYPCLVGTDTIGFEIVAPSEGKVNLYVSRNAQQIATFNNLIYGFVITSFSKMTPSGTIYVIVSLQNSSGNSEIIVYRWYNNSLIVVYDETMPANLQAFVDDIEFDYNGNIYFSMVTYNSSTNTSALQIWQITGTSSHSVFASIDSAPGATGYSKQNISIRITSYYTQTNIGSAVANGVYLTAQQQAGIPAYKRKIYNAMIK